jgi:hypothetical protein
MIILSVSRCDCDASDRSPDASRSDDLRCTAPQQTDILDMQAPGECAFRAPFPCDTPPERSFRESNRISNSHRSKRVGVEGRFTLGFLLLGIAEPKTAPCRFARAGHVCILEHVHACLCVRESVCVRARECESREESVRVKCLGDDIGLL